MTLERLKALLDEYGPNERFRLESIDTEIAVDDVYSDALGAIVTA